MQAPFLEHFEILVSELPFCDCIIPYNIFCQQFVKVYSLQNVFLLCNSRKAFQKLGILKLWKIRNLKLKNIRSHTGVLL